MFVGITRVTIMNKNISANVEFIEECETIDKYPELIPDIIDVEMLWLYPIEYMLGERLSWYNLVPE